MFIIFVKSKLLLFRMLDIHIFISIDKEQCLNLLLVKVCSIYSITDATYLTSGIVGNARMGTGFQLSNSTVYFLSVKAFIDGLNWPATHDMERGSFFTTLFLILVNCSCNENNLNVLKNIRALHINQSVPVKFHN